MGIKVLNLSRSKTIWFQFESDLDLNSDSSNFWSNSKSSTLMTPSLGNDIDLYIRGIPISTWFFLFLEVFLDLLPIQKLDLDHDSSSCKYS